MILFEIVGGEPGGFQVRSSIERRQHALPEQTSAKCESCGSEHEKDKECHVAGSKAKG